MKVGHARLIEIKNLEACGVHLVDHQDRVCRINVRPGPERCAIVPIEVIKPLARVARSAKPRTEGKDVRPELGEEHVPEDRRGRVFKPALVYWLAALWEP